MFRKLSRSYHSFSTHSRICIIGGGTGGIGVSSQLLRNHIHPSDIRIFEPSQNHYYQPGFTMVGSKLCKSQVTVRKMGDILPKNIPWTRQKVEKIDPESKTITAENGELFTYDQLVIASGIRLDWERIQGAKQLLDNPDSNVCSIYDLEYAKKTAKLGEKFKGGKAFFMEPQAPIKCAGAPQKILYLWTDMWQKKGVSFDVEFIKSAGVMFGQPKYSQALVKIAKGYGIQTTFGHTLLKITEDTAIFQNNESQEQVRKKFDFFHVIPPMSAHKYIRESGISDQTGFLDLHKGNLRHNKYHNIWGVGDCTNLPTSKTAAAAISQTQILVKNLTAAMKNPHIEKFPMNYEGYTSCPLFVGKGQLMLAEFKYGLEPDQTFFKDQEVPRSMFFYLKKNLLPNAYWNLMPRGLWKGRKGIRF